MLRNNAQLLSQYKTVTILVEGNCDERGTNEYNQSLGQRRADAVKNYMIDYGIDRSRISAVSYGEERMVDTGHSETAWAKNRRSEFIIVSTK
jgi:peptidoglycan-associated lipoprotein